MILFVRNIVTILIQYFLCKFRFQRDDWKKLWNIETDLSRSFPNPKRHRGNVAPKQLSVAGFELSGWTVAGIHADAILFRRILLAPRDDEPFSRLAIDPIRVCRPYPKESACGMEMKKKRNET